MTTAEIWLWGSRIGAVTLPAGERIASFEYDPGFQQSGIELSPLIMPLGGQVYRFPALAPESFHGLPGLLADSLPDKYGNALIDAWLATQGRTGGDFNAVERLCYTGNRGMGALEFKPTQGPASTQAESIEIAELVRLASEVLVNREQLKVTFAGSDKAEALREILRVGTSAGGARAKAIIAWNPSTNEVRSGQVAAPADFQYWLMKFDGVANNRDHDLADPKGYSTIEYVYSLMATDAGITMTDCRLFEEGGRRHFMTRRFDRLDDGDKLHMQSLAALAHLDFNQPRANAYEQAFTAIRSLGLGQDALDQMFRRALFNIIARNQDDHVKNIAFLMDRQGAWTLAPAYDLSYAYNPDGEWTAQHQTSGIGAATVGQLTREGAKVVFTGSNADAAAAVEGDTGAIFRAHRVEDAIRHGEGLMAEIEAEYGRLDIAFANAGTEAGDASVEDIGIDAWNHIVAVNQTGAMLTVQHAIRAMAGNPQGPKGSIIVNSSMNAHRAMGNYAAYSVTKAAVVALVKSAAIHCAGKGYAIRVNAILPGVVETDMIRGVIDRAPDPAAARAAFEGMAPMKRMAQLDEISALVAFLASDEAGFISGSDYVIDGATTAGMMGV